MAVKYVVLFLNICILFNVGNCKPLFQEIDQKYDTFDWKLFQDISSSSNKNIITSPFFVKLLLTIMREAASGITRNEIQNALADLPKGIFGLTWFEDIVSILERESSLYELNTATKVFLDQQQTPNATFLETAERYFHTKTQRINFGDTKQSAKIINDWCSDNTKGIVKEIVNEDQLRGASTVLTNAIYFKGRFINGFKNSSTKNMPFYKNNDEVVEAPMMFQQLESFLLKTPELGDGAQLLRLTYKGSKFAITFILPKDQNGLDKVIASIKPGLIGELQKKMKFVKVNVFIPKFEFNSQLSLKDSLEALNIKHVFTNDANLPGFGPHQTALSDVIQKSGIKVDEEGTEVAVVTAAKFVPVSASLPSATFIADHPFAFFIEYEASGALLFAGKVLDPTAK